MAHSSSGEDYFAIDTLDLFGLLFSFIQYLCFLLLLYSWITIKMIFVIVACISQTRKVLVILIIHLDLFIFIESIFYGIGKMLLRHQQF